MKILAVDDENDILELMPHVLSSAGYPDVTTASSGALALEILKTGALTFDCFCLDINMPEMHGIELCQQIRAMPLYSRTPIIMLTAMADRDHIDRAFRAGATDYVTKPFDFVELRARLRNAEQLVLARQETLDALAVAEAVAGKQINEHAPLMYLSDPDEIDGVEDLIGKEALGNYLGQLSRVGIQSTQVLAVKIDQAEKLFARSSADEVIYALTEVATAIREAFSAFGCMSAYVGKGVFVVIAHSPTLSPSVEIESAIASLLDDRNTEYDNGKPMDLEISVGNPIRPNPSMTQWFNRIFERAVVRAENRAASKVHEPSRSPFRFAAQ